MSYNLEEYFDQQIYKITKVRNPKLLIALSGGIDSMALAIMANIWANKNNAKITAVTIDHNLREDSKKDALWVGDIIKRKNIKHHVISWEEGKNITGNIEGQARMARYRLLQDFAEKHDYKYLVTAHHRDDQIETFLMRLMRGSGVDGLAAIEEKTQLDKVTLLRPLLEITKDQLKQYLLEKKCEWVEDSSNEDTKFLRNKLRLLLSRIEDKELLDKRLAQTINHMQRTKKTLAHITDNIFAVEVTYKENQYFINYKKFKNLDQDIAFRLLIKIFHKINNGHYKPRFENLTNFYKKLLSGKDIKNITFAKCKTSLTKDGQLKFEQEKAI